MITTRSLILSPQKCINCGRKIPDSAPCLTTRRGHLCMGCEFKEIEVYSITENGDVYYEKDPLAFLDAFKETMTYLDMDGQFTVGKRMIRALHYFDLPEWQGTKLS